MNRPNWLEPLDGSEKLVCQLVSTHTYQDRPGRGGCFRVMAVFKYIILDSDDDRRVLGERFVRALRIGDNPLAEKHWNDLPQEVRDGVPGFKFRAYVRTVYTRTGHPFTVHEWKKIDTD